MRFYQQVSLVIANDGISGLFRRAAREFGIATRSVVPGQAPWNEHNRLIEGFHRKALSMGFGDLRNYWWYHTIDLGNGLITPGCYDYRQSLPAFGFPADMKGLNVLDVGSATGFFAFEFEKRGANVTSVELPSSEDFDRFPGETLEQALNKFEELFTKEEAPLRAELRHNHLYQTSTPDEIYRYFVDGPFRFCQKVLNSKVRRCYSRIYDLSKENLGSDDFHLVFLGDVLVHTMYPLKALAAAAAVCRGTMIIAQDLPGLLASQAAMIYIGGDKVGEDNGSWWLPNRPCLEEMLRKLGFKDVAIVGSHSGFMRPTGDPYERTIIHATK